MSTHARSIHTNADFTSQQLILLQEVLHGLHQPQKELSCKYLYDETGSRLFDLICELDEYYISRTELKIMQTFLNDIIDVLGPNCMLIEYGCGSCTKTRLLLEALPALAAYVPIDIAYTHLHNTVRTLTRTYPTIEIIPICTDYTQAFTLPTPTRTVKRRIAYYPGSTIGNFDQKTAYHFLRTITHSLAANGGLLIGVDLKKDPTLLHRAYNDRAGVTAQFNLHLLERINQELKANFQLDQFTHYAFYNPPHNRVEMHLLSQRSQPVTIHNSTIHIRQGESIWTESSYKYTIEEFAHLANRAGLKVEHAWLDEEALFSVQYLTVLPHYYANYMATAVGSD
jgi:dimethylhistidine N-methyltransferase